MIPMYPFEVELIYQTNKTRHHVHGQHENEHVSTKTIIQETPLGQRWHVEVTPKLPITIIQATLTFNRKVTSSSTLFFNGYQSWTDSQELRVHDRLTASPFWAKPIIRKLGLDRYGDMNIHTPDKGKGVFYGFSYAYVKESNQIQLIGSIDEKSGFTIIEYRHKPGNWVLLKDNRHLKIDDTVTLFDVMCLTGSEDEVFDAWFKAMNIHPITTTLKTGWTSWYNHYQNITESIVLHNLKQFEKVTPKIDIFQIDDGYQQAIGDWLLVDPHKFPHGMKVIADAIHQQGIKAGIWLAPFAVEPKSQIYINHPEWLVKDTEGHPIKGGFNWGGFYVLDMQNEQVKAHLKHVCKVVLDDWGYDMVKLDFLYAACLIPTDTKPRGQLMAEAMDFLRECVGNKWILGCGVPLASAFGKVDFCRIGCDVGLDWDDKWYMRWLHRERISTYHAINNAIGRSHLHNRAFVNDPDVYLLREENNDLTTEQKMTLATANKLFGGLLFTSDDISTYTPQMKELFDWILDKRPMSIRFKTTIQKGIYELGVNIDVTQRIYVINTSERSYTHQPTHHIIRPHSCVIVEES